LKDLLGYFFKGYWLNKNENDKETTKQIIRIIQSIIEQNYFQYNDIYYQPNKGVAMGSPISGLIAEAYLQQIEGKYNKHWLNTNEITYYRRYVDDIVILHDSTKTQDIIIEQNMNNINKDLQFQMTAEKDKLINYMDLELKRNNTKMEIGIYRKATNTDTTIHYHSNHPYEQKIAAYRYYINRLLTLPITERAKTEEWKTIITTATNNG